MENPNYRPFNDARRANEQAWRSSEYFPMARRFVHVIFLLSAMMILAEMINIMISRHFDWDRCYNGIGFLGAFLGIVTSAVGIVALAVPWRRPKWIYSCFPLLVATTIAAFAVIVFSTNCFVGVVKMEIKTGSNWPWYSVVVGIVNVMLVGIGIGIAIICVDLLFMIPCLLPIGRFRELEMSGSPPPDVMRVDDDEKEMVEIQTRKTFINRQVVSGAFVRTPLTEVQV